MLAEWKLGGWAAMFGRPPETDDLIVPLPPEAAQRRRSRSGEAFRSHDYAGKRWREEDLPVLGWRHRRHYDMRATSLQSAQATAIIGGEKWRRRESKDRGWPFGSVRS